MLNENLGGILGGTQCKMSDSLILSECKLKIKFSFHYVIFGEWLEKCHEKSMGTTWEPYGNMGMTKGNNTRMSLEHENKI